MVRQAPGTGIDVLARREFAVLGFTAELGIGVATAQAPVASTGACVVFEHLHRITGLAQFVGRDHAGDAGTEHEY